MDGRAVSVALAIACLGAAARAEGPAAEGQPGLAIHLMFNGAHDLPALERLIRDGLAPAGVNVLVLEVNDNFAYQSHPEVSGPGALSAAQARELAAVCRAHKIRLIPMLNCLGHQSWKETPSGLLRAHPELDETPGKTGKEPDFYCRSWCPLHPDVNPIVFSLLDELIDAFEADAVHVGMDEVFEIADPACPRCNGKDPAELFARAVNDLHGHIAGQRGKEMWMWGDRFLDASETGYGRWEAAANGTAPAIDRVPKDIVICDWHYEALGEYQGKPDRYRSVGIFADRGFRVWTASWRRPETALPLLEEGRARGGERWQGHMNTTWIDLGAFTKALLDPKAEGSDRARGIAETFRATSKALRD
jgi:hypothetical protein